MKLVIDSLSLAYRSVYSMPELSFNKNPVSVLYGFMLQLLKLAEKFNTNQFIFVWDSRKSYRKMECSTYKQREITDDKKELIEKARIQFENLRKDVLPSMGFKNNYIQPGYEADDLIAFIIFRFPEEYTIVSKDEDLFQLLYSGRKGCSVQLYNLTSIITEFDFKRIYGIEPRKWCDVKGLAGCPSDTVPGIPGVGKDTAIKYLTGILKDGKTKDKIESEEGKKIFRDCFKLVALPYVGEISIDVKNPVEDDLYSLDFVDTFRKYGFNSFVEDDNFEKWRKAFNLERGRRS
jgi:DNA polymerase-1